MSKLTNKAPGSIFATLKSTDGITRNVVLPAGFSETLLPGEVVVSTTAPEGQYVVTE